VSLRTLAQVSGDTPGGGRSEAGCSLDSAVRAGAASDAKRVKPRRFYADPGDVRSRPQQHGSRARRLGRAAARICATLALVIFGYIALVQIGVLPNPLAPVARGDIAEARSSRPGLRVLFVGNSFTFWHSMPELVHRLAAANSRGTPVFTVEYTAPGWSLRQASHDGGLTKLLHKIRWDVVVLQEQSWLASLSLQEREQQMYPYAWSLDADISTVKARTMLFMTWGYKHGYGRENTYGVMQAALAEGYDDLGRRLHAPVAPVGLAWAEALRTRSDLSLWEGDGRHPSKLGSYLAACVFYAMLTHRDPHESGFTAGLSSSEARYLQKAAVKIVLHAAQ
jgi:hypothetical protein